MSADEPSFVPQTASRTGIPVNPAENDGFETISEIAARIAARYGCRTRGLLNSNRRLGGDPVGFAEIDSLPGIQSVSLG
jgi:hypothetical protein